MTVNKIFTSVDDTLWGFWLRLY